MEPTWYQGMLRKRAASLRKVLGKGIPSSSSSALPACGPGRSRPQSTEARPASRLQQSSSEPALAPKKARQVWRCIWKGKVGVRATPETDGERTGAILQYGDTFEVSGERRDADGVRFLKLADGRGWVFETKAEVGTVCVRYEPKSEVSAAERKEQSQEFIERQSGHRSLESRVSMAKAQRQLNKDSLEKEDSEFLGAQGVAGFRSFLAKRFGSISAGWRAMDSEGRGYITFNDFCSTCRKLGFHGNMRTLWKELDAKCRGSISLAELDPEAARYVDTFKQQLLRQYGNMATAWKEGLDTNGLGRVEEKDITACCQKLGLDLNGKKLYKLLRCSPPRSTLGLTLADFDEQLAKKMAMGDATAASPAKDGKESATASAGRSREADGEAPPMKLGLHTPEDFRKALVVRHGSLLAGWREAVDINGKGQVGFAEFCQAMSRLSFQGDVRSLFRQLDSGDKGCIVFADLDKEADALLSDFRAKLTEAHGNTMLAWVKALDRKGAGCVTKQQFIRACEKVGFSGDATRLFRILRPEVGRQNLTLKDFDPKAYQALTRGDFRMLSEAENPRKSGGEGLLEMAFEDRQNSSLYLQMRKGWDASTRAEFAKHRLEDVPDHAIDSAWEFEELCRRKYGSLISAWRHGLDTDANGKLTFNEFCKQCRLMGYVGNLKSLWAGYGGVEQGHIFLKNLDPEADAMVSSFLDLLTDRYGSVDAAWRKGFGKDPHDSVDEQELGKVCQAIGYETSHKKLFRCLRRSAAHVLLTVWDLDPSCRRARRRGDIVYKAEAKSPETFAGHQGHGGELLPESDGGKEVDAKGTKGQPLTTMLRRAMSNRHGSTVAAWRALCDTQESLDFAGFLRLLEDCNYGGLRKELWQEVAGDRTAVTFKDVDPDTQIGLDRTREGLLGRFETLTRAWREGIDTEKAGRVDEAAFVKVGGQLGLKHPKKVFWLLLSHQGQRSLVREDLRPLLIGLPVEQHAGAWGGDAETGPEAAPRVHMERLMEDFHGQDFLIASLDTFKQGLVVRFGSLFSAWRNHFDLNHNGIVSKAEFTKGCQHLGIKAVQRLWTDLDASQRGYVALKDLDPEANEAVTALEEALVKRYGSVHQGWTKFFELSDPPNKHVEQAKFTRQCQALGVVPGDPGKFFRLFRPDPGRKYLIYEDLWRAPIKKVQAKSRPGTTSSKKDDAKQEEAEPEEGAADAGQGEPPSSTKDDGGASEREEEPSPAHAADSAAPSPTEPASPAAAVDEEQLQEAAGVAEEGGGAQEAGIAEEAQAPPPPPAVESGSVSPVAPPSAEDADPYGDSFDDKDRPKDGELNELAGAGAAEAGEDYDEFDASASGADEANPEEAEAAGGYDDGFEGEGLSAPATPAAPPLQAEPSYEDDFSKEEDSRAPGESSSLSEEKPSAIGAELEAQPSYEDDFSKDDSSATADEPVASPAGGEAVATGGEAEAEPSYEDDFSKEEEDSQALADEPAASPAAAKPAEAVAEAEAEPSYEDDFSKEEDSQALAEEPAASPAAAKPAEAAAEVEAEAEASYDDDFSATASRGASKDHAAAADKAEASYEDFSRDASRAASKERAEGEEAYDDDDFSKDGSSRSSSRASTPSRRGSRKGSRSPSPASSRGSRGRRVGESYDDNDFASDAGTDKAPPSPAAPSSPGASEASARRQENESYDVDEFDSPPNSSRKPSKQAPALATHKEEEGEEEAYEDDDFASAPPTARIDPDEPAQANSSAAPEAQEYDDDFASATGVEEEDDEVGDKAVAPAPPATASTMPPPSALGNKAELDSTFGSHPPGLESTAGSVKPPDSMAVSKAGLSSTAPLLGQAEKSKYEPPPLKVSPELAQMMAERAAREKEREEEAKANATKDPSTPAKSEGGQYEDDFDGSHSSGGRSRSQSMLTSPPHSAPVPPPPKTPEHRHSAPPSLAQLMAAKAGKDVEHPSGGAEEPEKASGQAAGKADGEGDEEAAVYDDDFEDFE